MQRFSGSFSISIIIINARFPSTAAWPDAAERLDVTTFPTSGPVCQEAARGAAELVALAHTAHAFTNTADFTLRCGVCQVPTLQHGTCIHKPAGQ
jgi:hypothetical protein